MNMEAATAPRPDTTFESTVYHVKSGGSGTVLDINNLCLWYGASQALHNVQMTVEKGLVTALIGPSGCGKSTLLRCINRMNDLVDGLRIKGEIQLTINNI